MFLNAFGESISEQKKQRGLSLGLPVL